MQRLFPRIASLLTLTFALVFANHARADILAPGGSGLPDIFTFLGGQTLQASITGTWTNSTSTMSGSYLAAVFSDPSNTFGAGDLDFMYQVTNSANSLDSVGRTTAINFTGSLTDVGFTALGSTLGAGFINGTVAPVTVDRSISGDSIGFSFTPPVSGSILPGQTSMVLVIETNATSFIAGHLSLIDGGVTTVAAFQPVAPKVPEPSSKWFLAMALGGVLLTLCSRKFPLVNLG
jgi:hypothetical protein